MPEHFAPFNNPSQNILNGLQPLLGSYEMDWALWRFNLIINNVNIEHILLEVYEKCQKTKPKTKTSLDYGIIDLNDGIILKVLGNSVTSYFEVKMKDYKPKKAISEEAAAKALKKFNVTSIKDLGKALAKVKVDYNNLDRDIVYLHHLFQKLDEVESLAQKLLDKKSQKRKKYDGILLFSRHFEFIYVETATKSILSKPDKDLSKLHNAIVLMFKLMVSTLPEKLLHEISSMPILCVQFSGSSVEVYLANWPANLQPIVFFNYGF
nr:9827_t:CDS:2 [Entrophospora candida]